MNSRNKFRKKSLLQKVYLNNVLIYLSLFSSWMLYLQIEIFFHKQILAHSKYKKH